MLRITVEDGAERLVTLRLEGTLAGPWLRELEACWQNCVGLQDEQVRYVDLAGVTFIDSAGKACLAAMYRQGAEFIAADCMTKEVVAEIERLSLAEGSELASTTKPQGVSS